MSIPIPEKSADDSAASRTGSQSGIPVFRIDILYGSEPSTSCRVPFSVADFAMQLWYLGGDFDEILRACRDQVAVRLAAGWPQWAGAPEHLENVMRELALAQRVLAAHQRRSENCDDGATQPLADVWFQDLTERLIRAGWLANEDQSEPTVAYAVNVAFFDCIFGQIPPARRRATRLDELGEPF